MIKTVRPMESAPKDGTKIILFFTNSVVSAEWKRGRMWGKVHKGWMGFHGKWVSDPLGWVPFPENLTCVEPHDS